MSPWSSSPAQRARSQALVAAGREADRLLEQARRIAVTCKRGHHLRPEETRLILSKWDDSPFDPDLAARFDAAPTLDQCLRDARGQS